MKPGQTALHRIPRSRNSTAIRLAPRDAPANRCPIQSEQGREPHSVLHHVDVRRSSGALRARQLRPSTPDQLGHARAVPPLRLDVDLREVLMRPRQRPQLQAQGEILLGQELGLATLRSATSSRSSGGSIRSGSTIAKSCSSTRCNARIRLVLCSK